ncbi:hypothetical protein CAEBREN_04563 [Caenorhabditis brenneri]|uniref:Uncharacterized protein n=1 Tax=Caenorhabditis brenneri TaxID=135651 RepID=G0NXU6_CAEBE|nr:hypothetical protein CAEBREN_04563 [Caenorhabditis brenneri]
MSRICAILRRARRSPSQEIGPSRLRTSILFSPATLLHKPKLIFKKIFRDCRLEVTDSSTKEQKYVVRGYYRCHFHDDILQEVKGSAPSGLKLKCVGGGRIKHDDTDKDILVYGYSQGYGQADHTIAVGILQKKYPGYNIHFSNDGY